MAASELLMNPALSDRDAQRASVEIITRRVMERLAREGLAAPGPNLLLSRPRADRIVPVGISVRHCHVTREHFEILFGKGAELTERNRLYQATDFAANETVTVVGRRMRALENVRILGPLRKYTQVEVSRTDAIYLGEDPPIRESGDLSGSTPVLIIGPKGSLHLNEGLILATRHIHLSEEESAYFGLKTLDRVNVHINGPKPLTFENVTIKVYAGHRKELHLDTDDANAACIMCGVEAEMMSAE